MSDYERAARLAAEHLIGLGHTRIGAIEGAEEVTSGRLHHAGFTAAMADAGLPVPDELVHRGLFTPEFGCTAATALLALPEPPTALLISNHEASFGALPVLGLHVPEQLSVICTEEEPLYSWWSPPLTTVDNRAALQAERAAALLLAQLDGAESDCPVRPAELVDPVLVVRGSTAPPR
jgi:LacI family transcriptional regulator